MTDLILRRTLHGFEPADEYNAERLRETKIAVGNIVKCKVTMPRNLEFHRKFFAMIRETFDLQDTFDNIEHWRAVCLTGAGHCDFVPGRNGEMVAIPKSIAFSKLDETEFTVLYDKVIDFIGRRYLPDHYGHLIEAYS